MELRIKGFLRRLWTYALELQPVTRVALSGIAVLALVALALIFGRNVASSEFVITEGSAVAIAQEPELIATERNAGEEAEEVAGVVVVHIGGAVANPGVYELPQGARLSDAVFEAGGLLPEANQDGVNLAQLAADGTHVVIPVIGEVTSQDDSLLAVSAIASSNDNSQLISINTADVAELTKLDGIGEVLAKRIVDYREKIGGFTSLKQLQSVSGIGSKRFGAIKDDICL